MRFTNRRDLDVKHIETTRTTSHKTFEGGEWVTVNRIKK